MSSHTFKIEILTSYVYSFDLIRDFNQIIFDVRECSAYIHVNKIIRHDCIIDISTNIPLTEVDVLELEKIVMGVVDPADV